VLDVGDALVVGHTRLEGRELPRLRRLLARAVAPVQVQRLSAKDRELGRSLWEAGILVERVPAHRHLRVLGRSPMAEIVRRGLLGLFLPANTPIYPLAVLGQLGSAGWRAEVERLGAHPEPMVPLSTEGHSIWLGPLWQPGRPGCPLCLLHRRAATGRAELGPLTCALPARGAALPLAARMAAEPLLARRAVRIFDVRGNWHDPLPSGVCPICAPAAPFAGRSGQKVRRRVDKALRAPEVPEPDELVRRQLADAEVGPLTVSEIPTQGGFRPDPLQVAGFRTLAPAHSGLEVVSSDNAACGTGMDRAHSARIALSEALERLMLVNQRPDLQGVTAARLGDRAVPPEALFSFRPDQADDPRFPFARHLGQPLDWGWTYELTEGRARLLPFDALVVRRGAPTGRRLFEEPFFTGGAAHLSMRRAVGHALLECIERDAFLLAWYLQLPLRRLQVGPKALTAHGAAMRSFLEARGIEVTFHDMAVDLPVPTVLASAVARQALGTWPRAGRILSGCSALTWPQAIERTLKEILGQFTALCCTEPPGEQDAQGPEEAWQPLFTRYLHRDVPEHFRFLGAAGTSKVPDGEVGAGGEALGDLLGLCRARGYPVFVRPLEGPETACSGLTVVKVVVGGFLRPMRSRLEVPLGLQRVDRIARAQQVSGAIHPHDHPQA
jgi:ribosomal protein S12 methylthiotransferase accessory factor